MRPYSCDPMEYDYFGHAVAFRSVLSPLITRYRAGKVLGALVESWQHDEAGQVWTFKIRHGMTFQNGDLISGKVILQSLTRIAFLQRAKGSRSTVFDSLLGWENLKAPRDAMKGLQLVDNTLVFTFSKPKWNLLSQLSFGLYAITHPSDYVSSTGAWIDAKRCTASSHYQISEWTDDKLLLGLRKDFLPELRLANAPEQVLLEWRTSEFLDFDMAYGNSTQKTFAPSFEFHGPTNFNIAYAHVYSFKKHPFFRSRENRLALRDAVYDEMEKNGEHVVRSFFPKSIAGVAEVFSKQQSRLVVPKGLRIRFRKWDDSIAYIDRFFTAFEGASFFSVEIAA